MDQLLFVSRTGELPKLGRISWITKLMSHLEKSWEREMENGSEDPQYGVSYMCLKKMEEN